MDKWMERQMDRWAELPSNSIVMRHLNSCKHVVDFLWSDFDWKQKMKTLHYFWCRPFFCRQDLYFILRPLLVGEPSNIAHISVQHEYIDFCNLTQIPDRPTGYTTTPVACGWAGAIFEVTWSFRQEQWDLRQQKPKKSKVWRMDRRTDPQPNGGTAKAGCRVA